MALSQPYIYEINSKRYTFDIIYDKFTNFIIYFKIPKSDILHTIKLSELILYYENINLIKNMNHQFKNYSLEDCINLIDKYDRMISIDEFSELYELYELNLLFGYLCIKKKLIIKDSPSYIKFKKNILNIINKNFYDIKIIYFMFFNVKFIESEINSDSISNYEYDDIEDYNQFEFFYNKNDFNNFLLHSI